MRDDAADTERPRGKETGMEHHFSYQAALADSERINWRVEDIIGAAGDIVRRALAGR